MDRIYIKKSNLFYLNTYIRPVEEIIEYDIFYTILDQTKHKGSSIRSIIVNEKEIEKDFPSDWTLRNILKKYIWKAREIYIDRSKCESKLYIVE